MKRGKIKIAGVLYNQNYDAISVLFLKFKPLHIEYPPYENDIFVFYGTCDSFDIVKEGEVIPFYDVVFTADSTGKQAFKFNRI